MKFLNKIKCFFGFHKLQSGVFHHESYEKFMGQDEKHNFYFCKMEDCGMMFIKNSKGGKL